jgi:hypothetical protein
MNNKQTLYFVTSLPRTGTTSLCKMADICGLKSLHILRGISFYAAIENNSNFFADSPFYSPEFLIGILEYGIQQQYSIKFIYSIRDTDSHVNSLNKLYKTWTPPKINHITKKIDLFDNLNYSKFSREYIQLHHTYIQNIANMYNIELLSYIFSDGWENFCRFIDRPVPNAKIPWLNKL